MTRDNFYNIRDIQIQLANARLLVKSLEDQLAVELQKRFVVLQIQEKAELTEAKEWDGTIPQ